MGNICKYEGTAKKPGVSAPEEYRQGSFSG